MDDILKTRGIIYLNVETWLLFARPIKISGYAPGPSKGILSRSKDSDTNLLQSTNFAYEVGINSSYSNRICYRKIAKSRTKDAWGLHATLRTVFENHCSTSNTTPAS